jgi:hypothetical protein
MKLSKRNYLNELKLIDRHQLIKKIEQQKNKKKQSITLIL